METALKILFNPVTEAIILTVLGFAIKGFVKYKKLYQEITDIGKKYLEGINPKSPGGKNLTKDEYVAIGKEVVEALQAAAAVFPRKQTS